MLGEGRRLPMKRLLLLLFLVIFAGQPAGCKSDADKEVLKEGAVKEAPPPTCEPCPVCPATGEVPGDADAKEPGDQGPEECVLYHLVDRYEPTVFTHSNHVEYEEDCTVCHHHSSEVESYPPCRACHGIAFKDLNKPGLKGAYHRQCMNCHRQMESGPLGCEDCHAVRTPAPVAQEDLARKYVPDTMKLGHLSADFAEVVFNHRLHAELTDHCDACHHHHGDVEVAPPCRECHKTAETKEGGKAPGLKNAYHDQCLNCHRALGKKGKKAPLNCTDCHLSRKAPETVELGAASKQFEVMSFDHSMHTETTDYCTDCHHSNKSYDRIVACGECHLPGKQPEGKLNRKSAFHKQCVGCHKEQDEGPQDCDDCHEKKE